jgi:hypothetical protein
MAWPPGHFYSPVPDVDEVRGGRERIWNSSTVSIAPIPPQIELLNRLRRHYAQIPPWGAALKHGLRFHHGQYFFWGTDAIIYYLMLREFRPSQVIEVGSGHSSHLLLDVIEHIDGVSANPVFIEPYPERLKSSLTKLDGSCGKILEMRVQDVPLETFDSLNAGDLLFIDSSHVSKCGSDVNFLFFDVLPRLKVGVIIHVHDIFWPFEYPFSWIERGRSWNEAYLLRSLLTGNDRYEVLLFVDQLLQCVPNVFSTERELHPEVGAYGSFWMRVASI